jgi:hypothetical protein
LNLPPLHQPSPTAACRRYPSTPAAIVRSSVILPSSAPPNDLSSHYPLAVFYSPIRTMYRTGQRRYHTARRSPKYTRQRLQRMTDDLNSKMVDLVVCSARCSLLTLVTHTHAFSAIPVSAHRRNPQPSAYPRILSSSSFRPCTRFLAPLCSSQPCSPCAPSLQAAPILSSSLWFAALYFASLSIPGPPSIAGQLCPLTSPLHSLLTLTLHAFLLRPPFSLICHLLAPWRAIV